LILCCIALCGTQVHALHGSCAELAHQAGPRSSSSSSSTAMLWQQRHQVLTQWPLQAPWSCPSGISSSSCSTSQRPYSTSLTPLQQAAFADSTAVAESAANEAQEAGDKQPGSQLNPAAAPKQIEGVCRRRNIKCGWKKIDFVLRMVSVSGARRAWLCTQSLCLATHHGLHDVRHDRFCP
jgi:hypothetical protein